MVKKDSLNALHTSPGACKQTDGNGCHSTSMASSRMQTFRYNKNEDDMNFCKAGLKSLALNPTDTTRKLQASQFDAADEKSFHRKNYVGTPPLLQSNGYKGSHCYPTGFVKTSNSSCCSGKSKEGAIPQLNSRKNEGQDVSTDISSKGLHEDSIAEDVRSVLGDVLLKTRCDACSKSPTNSSPLLKKCDTTKSEQHSRAHDPVAGNNYHSRSDLSNYSGVNVFMPVGHGSWPTSATNYDYVGNGIAPIQQKGLGLYPYRPAVASVCYSVQPKPQHSYQNIANGIQTRPKFHCGYERRFPSNPQMVFPRYVVPVNQNPNLIFLPNRPVIEITTWNVRFTKKVAEQSVEIGKHRCPEKRTIRSMNFKSCDQKSTVTHPRNNSKPFGHN